MDIDTVKKDLRQLRKISHSIEALLTMKEKHERRLAFLSERSYSPEVEEEKRRIQNLLKGLDLQGYIRRATALEEKYMAAIDKLEPLDKKIIIDGYINGKAYYKIGRDIGYTEAGIRKRIEKIIKQIQANM